MKIGIVCYPSIGGSGIVATELGNKLSLMGHKIFFISYEEPFRLIKNENTTFHKVEINEYSLFKYPDYTLPLAVKISDIHHKYNLDVVHAHYAVPHAAASLLAKNICNNCMHSSPKVITTLHGTDISLLAEDKSLKPIIQYSIEKSDGVTAVSAWLARETLKKIKIKKEIEVIHNFYDPVKPKKDKLGLRWKLGLRPNDFVAIHMSNLRPVKRIHDLLKIVSEVKNNKFKLLLLAGGDFSKYQPVVKKLGIENRVVVKKNVLDIENYITASDIGLFTSESESFGLSVLECMSYGVPVVSTSVGGIPEVVLNNDTGFLFDLGDIFGMAKKLDFLTENRDEVRVMGEKSKIFALEEFNSEKQVQKYEDFYKKACYT